MTADRFLVTAFDDERNWQTCLQSLPITNLFLTWAWGEYKARTGWKVSRLRICSPTNESISACLQLQEKRIGPARIFMIQGGIQGSASTNPHLADIYQFLSSEYLSPGLFDLILVNHYTTNSSASALGLLQAGYKPLLSTEMFTVVIRLGKPESSLRDGLSGNWRHNLSRAQKKSLSVRWPATESERLQALGSLRDYYRALAGRKQFAEAIDLDAMATLIAADPQFIIAEAILDGSVIAVRVAHLSADHMLDFLAASGDLARNTYANYLLLWEMVKKANALGKAYFECGGIDPRANPGVFNFKKGLGGECEVAGPLWVTTRTKLLSWLARSWISAGS